jgi:KUP system potassium uptake protein
LRVVFEPVPSVPLAERVEYHEVGEGFHRVVLHYGFMQTPNIPSELRHCAELGLNLDLDEVHYVVSHIDLLAGRKRDGMPLWRDKLFAFLAHNTQDPSVAYHIPLDQQVSVGQRMGI